MSMSLVGRLPRRKHERSQAPDTGLVDVFKNTRFGLKKWLGPTLMQDISAGGVAIRMDNAMPIGEILYLRSRTVTITGKVCRCVPLELGFKIGLEFVSHKPSVEKSALTPDVAGRR